MLAIRRAALLLRPAPGGHTFANPEAAAFIARTNPAAPDAIKAAYDGLVSDLKAGPVNGTAQWGADDFLMVATPAGSPLAMMNLMADSLDPTLVGAPIGHALYGYTTDGAASYLELPVTPAALVQYQQADCSLTMVTRRPEAQGGTFPQAGTPNAPGAANAWLCTRNSGNQAAFRLQDATTSIGGITDGSGTWTAVRDGTTKRLFRNGVQVGADQTSASTTAKSSSPIRIGSAFATFAQDQVLLLAMGRKRSAAEAADFAAAVDRFKAAIGWQPLFTVGSGAAAVAAAAVALPAPATITVLPDNPGGVFAADNLAPGGKGFTCTGAARDADGSFWVCAFGRNVQGNTSRTPQPAIVHLAADRQTVLGVIDLVALGAPAAGLQGITIDTSDGSLWAVYFNNSAGVPNLIHLARSTSAPALLDSFVLSPAVAPNAISYDPVRDALYISTGNGFSLYGKTGVKAAAPFFFSAPYVDQATYCADLDAWLVTGGENGGANNGYVIRIDRAGQSFGFPRMSAIYRSAQSDAIEGVTWDPATRTLTLFNDSWFHGTTGSAANRTFAVQAPF